MRIILIDENPRSDHSRPRDVRMVNGFEVTSPAVSRTYIVQIGMTHQELRDFKGVRESHRVAFREATGFVSIDTTVMKFYFHDPAITSADEVGNTVLNRVKTAWEAMMR